MHGFTSLSLSLSLFFFFLGGGGGGGREGIVLCCPAYSILKALGILFQELRIILYFSLVCVGVLLCLAFFFEDLIYTDRSMKWP